MYLANSLNRPRSLLFAFGILCLGSIALPALAATSAGTSITNQVTLHWATGGLAQPAASTSASFVVAQRVRLAVTWQDAGEVEVPAGASGTLRFRLTNLGNGTDSFTLSTSTPGAPPPSFTAAQCRIYLDATLTQAYSPGINDPSLAPGAHEDLYVHCQVPAHTPPNEQAWVELEAASSTLTGKNQAKCLSATCSDPTQTAAVLEGQWAVTDSTGGEAIGQGEFLAITPSFQFPLTQGVQDPSGGGQVMTGSTVTYTMKVVPTGTSTAYDARVVDPIPDHTTYKPGSITLDGASQTDAQDGDRGHFDAANNRIVVELGEYRPNEPTRVITFEVVID